MQKIDRRYKMQKKDLPQLDLEKDVQKLDIKKDLRLWDVQKRTIVIRFTNQTDDVFLVNLSGENIK